MTDTIKTGDQAWELLHDSLWKQYQEAALADLTQQLLDADVKDTGELIRLKTLIRHIQGFEHWLVGKTRNAEWARREKEQEKRKAS